MSDEQPPTPQPTTAEVLAEVERRRSAGRPVSEKERGAIILADRFVFWLSKHWLAIANTLAFLYIGLPFLAPVLMHLGVRGPAMMIHIIYRPLCHQYPQRSFFLFGPQLTYWLPELVARVGEANLPGYPWPSAFVGNAAVGYKVALCQRDVAIYGTLLLAGLLYGVLRQNREGWKTPHLPLWAFFAMCVPMVIDGGYQWLSYVLNFFLPNSSPIPPHETTPLLRVVTGAIFGLAVTWLAYPYLQEAMDEFKETLHKRFGWE